MTRDLIEATTLSDVLKTPSLHRLLDVRQGINMSVEVFDRNAQPLLPPLSGPAATPIRQLVTIGGLERWKPIIEECLRTGADQSREGKSLIVVATPIVVADATVGVVLVASTRDAGSDAGVVLKQVAEWFSDVIGARLSPRHSGQPASVRQLSSLYRLLSDAVPTATDRMLVYRYAEALAIWADVEIRAYLGDVGGQYSLAVSLPGSASNAAPAGFETRPIPEGAAFRHLSVNECRELGFEGVHDMVLAAVGEHAPTEWFLAASPAMALDDAHLPLYVDALAHALSDLYAVESSRLTWAVMQRFIELEAPEGAARAALAEIEAYIHAPVHFAAFGPRGRVLFSGDHAALLASAETADVFSVNVAAPDGYTATIGARRTPGRLFAHRDMRCLHTAAFAFASWLPHALARLPGQGERRNLSQSFDQIVGERSRAAAKDDISLLVIGPREGGLGAEAAQRWIGRIREHLRPTDLAGRFSSGEIGVLLPQTPHAGARVVGRRLGELFNGTSLGPGLSQALVRVASRSPSALVSDLLPSAETT